MKNDQINRNWHLIDAKRKVLGRLASEAAYLLMGKNKSSYVPYLDSGDYVVVINAKDVVLSGKKEFHKKYYHHSHFPGGLKIKTAAQIREENPQKLIRNAIIGMMPKTKLGKMMLKNIFVYSDNNYPYASKFIATVSTTPQQLKHTSLKVARK